jgi:transcriptional regulator with XRE-family HTH domain
LVAATKANIVQFPHKIKEDSNMNIEIANRLFELRKQKNLSQEELAEKIGVSRQAVSKWERAKSSPDTNNLIELARLYEISLDELLFTTEPVPREKEEDKKEYVSIGFNGIHVKEKDGSEVHIGLKGIHVKNKNNPDFADEIEKSWDEAWGCRWGGSKDNMKKHLLYTLPAPLIVATVYLIMGFIYNLWHPGWVIFLAIPIYYETVGMFMAKNAKKKLNLFPLALICTAIYLILGFYYNLWHPGWIVFLSIPLYHSFVHAIHKSKE